MIVSSASMCPCYPCFMVENALKYGIALGMSAVGRSVLF